jgi:Fe-S-cluster containining protein
MRNEQLQDSPMTTRKIAELSETERQELRRHVFRLYDEADAEIRSQGPVCLASGKCCRFKEYGHTLFLSHLEADVLLYGAPTYQAPTDPGFCPFQKNELCTAREHRPLGCRVYFCDPAYAGKGEVITETYLAKLKTLAQTFNLGWLYAPLHYFLDSRKAE